jgi:dCMP deaminase
VALCLIVSVKKVVYCQRPYDNSDGYNGTLLDLKTAAKTKREWDVLHAEANAILKVARSTQSCEGATLYITLSPCKECSKLIHQSGIKRVVYHNGYRDD